MSNRATLGVLAAVGVGVALGSCPSKLPAGEHVMTTSVGGRERKFYVYIPTGMSPSREGPGVVMIHGCGSSPNKFEMESQMNLRAEKLGYYNIFMEGTDNSGSSNPRLGWNAGFSQCNTRGAVNDVDFTRAVVLWMLDNLCIDPDRIFAAGFSNGGSMAFNLTCEMPEVFAGFSFTGSTMPPSAYPNNPTCGGGIADRDIKPILGLCGSLDGCSSSIKTWFQEYSKLSSCAGNPVEIKISDTSTCWRHASCGVSRVQPLEYCMVNGLGHCWSGNNCCDNQCLGQDPANMDFSAHVLNFFTGVPMMASSNRTQRVAKLRRLLE